MLNRRILTDVSDLCSPGKCLLRNVKYVSVYCKVSFTWASYRPKYNEGAIQWYAPNSSTFEGAGYSSCFFENMPYTLAL
jgi:hypothetical protein